MPRLQPAPFPWQTAIGARAFGNLPAVYYASRVMAALMDGGGVGLDDLRAANDALLEQFYVVTAGDEGLARWEEFLGLPIRPAGLSMPERRDRCLAVLRANRTPTLPVLRTIAESFAGATVRLVEDIPGYRLVLIFEGVTGVPARLADVYAALRTSAQAELQLDFYAQYATWEGMHASGDTWEGVHATGLTWEGLLTHAPYAPLPIWPAAA